MNFESWNVNLYNIFMELYKPLYKSVGAWCSEGSDTNFLLSNSISTKLKKEHHVLANQLHLRYGGIV